MSLESVPGTSATRLALLGRAVGASMGTIRGCYENVVEQRPAVAGRLRIRVALGERGAPTIDVVEDGASDAELVRCVTRAISGQPMDDASRPATAIIVLEFANTAAAGATESARRVEEASEVAIAREEGRPTASGEASGVRFVVRGAGDAPDESVAEAFRVLRSQIAGMLDCRRRASRREMDPTGQIDLRMSMRQGRAPEMTIVRSTVRDERAPTCLERALERPQRRPQSARGPFDIEVHFSAD